MKNGMKFRLFGNLNFQVVHGVNDLMVRIKKDQLSNRDNLKNRDLNKRKIVDNGFRCKSISRRSGRRIGVSNLFWCS